MMDKSPPPIRPLPLRPPPPPPPRPPPNNLPSKSSRSAWTSLPRLVIIGLTILGLFFIFTAVKHIIRPTMSADISETPNASSSPEGSREDEVLPPLMPSSGSAQGASTASDPVVEPAELPEVASGFNPRSLDTDLSSVESDLRNLRTLPNLAIYKRIENDMRLMALTQVAVLESRSEKNNSNIDIEALRTSIAELEKIDDSPYQTYTIAAYSQLAASAGRDIAKSVSTDIEGTDISRCSALLELETDDLFVATRDGILALALAYISLGHGLAQGAPLHQGPWAGYSHTADAIRSSEDHVLLQIEKAHLLLFEVIQSCCTLPPSSHGEIDKLAEIDASQKSALITAKNLYDKIGAHTEASVQALLLFARKLPSLY